MESFRQALDPWINGELTAVTSGVFWSVSVILLRLSGLSLAPIPLTFFKSSVAVVCFFSTSLFLGLPLLPSLGPEAYGRLVISALLGIAIADTLFVAALNRLGASLQALADCIYSPSIALVGFLMLGESLSGLEIVGGSLVLCGVVVGVGVSTTETNVKSTRELLFGVALAAGAHLIMAVGILMVRDLLRSESVVWISGFRFLIATIILGLYAGWKKEDLWSGFRRVDLYKWTVTLSILGPFLATIFWASGFKYATAGRAAIFNQLSTVFIIILARIFLAEKLTPRRTAGIILAALGSILVASSG